MKKQLLNSMRTLFVAAGLLAGACAWADDVLVPTPVYFNDFSFATSGSDGIEIVGSGTFETDADERFGKVFSNAASSTPRSNYLKLPTTVFSAFTTDGGKTAMTVNFWVNAKNAGGVSAYTYAPLFAAYGAAPTDVEKDGVKTGTQNTWPMICLQSRGLIQINNAGWCNFEPAQNKDGKTTIYNTNAWELDGNHTTEYASGGNWLDDSNWHLYTLTLTATQATVYLDGEVKNQWNVDGSDGQNISGMFTASATNLTYVCLGGNQAWALGDNDAAFMFDDFAVYDQALNASQISQIIANKKNRTVTGIQIGAKDNSNDYLMASTSQIKLKPGESYHYRFVNYNGGGTNNWNNWVLPVYNTNGDRVITVRADNYEDLHHVGNTWGSNAGCVSNFSWADFVANMNGATVDMTVSFTSEKIFNMSSTINTIDGSTWTYSYTNNYTETPIDLTGNSYVNVALSVSRSWLDLLSEGYSAISATIGSTGWTTFASPYALDLSDLSGATAYYASAVGGSSVTMTSTTQAAVQAGEGIMLKGTAEATVTIPVVASGTAISGNKLVGCPTETNLEANASHYVLVNNGGIAEFQSLEDYGATIPGGKAYLNASAAGARQLSIVFADAETTSVNDGLRVEKDKSASTAIYDLQGRRVSKPQKGLYIVGERKVIVK